MAEIYHIAFEEGRYGALSCNCRRLSAPALALSAASSPKARSTKAKWRPTAAMQQGITTATSQLSPGGPRPACPGTSRSRPAGAERPAGGDKTRRCPCISRAPATKWAARAEGLRAVEWGGCRGERDAALRRHSSRRSRRSARARPHLGSFGELLGPAAAGMSQSGLTAAGRIGQQLHKGCCEDIAQTDIGNGRTPVCCGNIANSISGSAQLRC